MNRASVWGAVWHFARDAASPVPKARKVYGWVSFVLLLTTLVGGFLQPWVWVGSLALVAVLSTYAGIRLQLAEERRISPEFTVHPSYKRRKPQRMTATEFKEEALLWATVTNHGPAAEFFARIRNVKGTDAGGDYSVEAIAWEYGGTEPRYRIERGGRERLWIGRTYRAGPADSPRRILSFSLPHPGRWGSGQHGKQGKGMDLQPGSEVSFLLEVVNVDAEVQLSHRLKLKFHDDGTVAGFLIG